MGNLNDWTVRQNSDTIPNTKIRNSSPGPGPRALQIAMPTSFESFTSVRVTGLPRAFDMCSMAVISKGLNSGAGAALSAAMLCIVQAAM